MTPMMNFTYCDNLCIKDCIVNSTVVYPLQASFIHPAAATVSFQFPTTAASVAAAAAASAGNTTGYSSSYAKPYNIGGDIGDALHAGIGDSHNNSLGGGSSLHVQAFLTCLMSVCNFEFYPNETSGLLKAHRSFVANLNGPLKRPGNCSDNRYRAYRIADNIPGRYAVPMNGYIAPVLVFLTLINNSLVCIVLMKPHMRSPTNAILVAMAISDILTGLFPIPIYVHIYASELFYEWMPFNWCYAFMCLGEYIPTIFHTASIWLTMALAIQRYIYVCHSFKARTWCTVRNVVYGTAVIYILSCLSHATRFFESDFIEVSVQSKIHPENTVSGCLMEYRPFVKRNTNLYFNIYYWYRVVFIHFVPCVSLVVMNALLIYAMKMAQIRRMQLLRQNKKTESRKLKESNCTTLMLVAVVGLFLLVEFPLAVLIILLILEQSFEVSIIEADTYRVLSLTSNFFILLSYPLNFFIYCGMSKQFRETFKRLFTGSDMPVDKEYSQYMTLATENGKSTAVTATAGDETAL